MFEYNYKKYAIEEVINNGLALEFVSYHLQNDKEVVLEAVKQNGLALQYASCKHYYYTISNPYYNLKNDKEIVLQAVKQNGLALKYATYILQNDKEVVLEAVKNNDKAFKYASDEIHNNKEVVLEAVKLNGLVLGYVFYEFKDDKEVVLQAVKNDGFALHFASTLLKDDKEIVFESVKQNGRALFFASDKYKNDKEIVFEAIKNDIRVLNLYNINVNLDKFDTNFIIDCIMINNKINNYLSPNNLYLLIHNLQYNFNTKLIVLDELFLNNINYISKTKDFYNILNFILTNHLKVFIENYNKFIHYIVNNLEYIQLCQEYNIHIFNIDEVTSYGEYNFDYIKKLYELQYKDNIILWY